MGALDSWWCFDNPRKLKQFKKQNRIFRLMSSLRFLFAFLTLQDMEQNLKLKKGHLLNLTLLMGIYTFYFLPSGFELNHEIQGSLMTFFGRDKLNYI